MSKLQHITSLEVEELEEGDALELPPREEKIILKKDEKFESKFTPIEELGKGKFGVVKSCRDKKTGTLCAAKYIRKTDQSVKDVYREIEIMNLLHHKRLINLLDAYDVDQYMIVVMELITGGELFEKVVLEDNLTERQVVRYMRQVLFGLQHMHRKGIVHLDLKPENILCVGGGKSGYEELKLIDFGMSRKLESGKETRVACGTAEFVSPEVLNSEPVSLASDMWSIGVITYILMSGLSPFMGENDSETMMNVANGEYDFDDGEDIFNQVSDDAKMFIQQLLVLNPKQRNTVDDCLNHIWFVNTKQEKKLKTQRLKKFIIRRRWQRATNAIKAISRLDHLGHRNNNHDEFP